MKLNAAILEKQEPSRSSSFVLLMHFKYSTHYFFDQCCINKQYTRGFTYPIKKVSNNESDEVVRIRSNKSKVQRTSK